MLYWRSIFFVSSLLLWGACSALARESWFSATMVQGVRPYSVTVRIHEDSVWGYKGNHQIATLSEPGATYPGIFFSLETQFRSADTTFHLHSTALFRAQTTLQPIWQNTVRSGVRHVEWTRRLFVNPPVSTEFHSLLHGDGRHTFEEDAIAEEFLYLKAPTMDSLNPHAEFKVLAPVWEQPYSMKAWTAVGNHTGQKLRIDGVDCYQIVFTRSDGATSEYFISEKGRLVFRFKSFRGTWFSRVQ